MNRFVYIIKKVFIVVVMMVAAVFITGTIISLFYGKEVKTYIITQLNKQLRSKVIVKEDDISFSVLSHFPNASVEFKDITMLDAEKRKMEDGRWKMEDESNIAEHPASDLDSPASSYLMKAEKVSLLFNIVSLFKKDYTIKQVELKNGQINLKVNEYGVNYKFWKESKDTVKSGKGSVINLQSILLNNVTITYINTKAHHDYLLNVSEGIMEGHFTDEQFTLATDASLSIQHLLIDNFNYIDNKEAQLALHMKVNNKTDEYRFEKSRLKLADVTFDVDGTYTNASLSDYFDLKISAHKASLESFVEILPPVKAVHNYFEHFDSKGILACTININGALDKQNTPLIDIDYSVKDGKITPKHGNESLKGINLKGRYYNKSETGRPVSTIEVNTFSATLGGRPVKGDFRFDDLLNPYLTLHANAELNMEDLRPFVVLDTLKEIHGDMAVNLSFAGRISVTEYGSIGVSAFNTPSPHNSNTPIRSFQASGTVKLNKVSFRLKNNPLEFNNFNGTLTLNNSDVTLSDCRGNVSSTDFQLDGVFKDLVPFILLPQQETAINANLVSNKIDLDELLLNKNESDTRQLAGQTDYKLSFSPYLNCKLNVNIGAVQLRRFNATNIRGQIVLANQVISGSSLTFNAMKGNVEMTGKINATRKDSITMSCDVDIHGVDIREVFYELENFHQNTMKDENLKGKVTANVQFASIWSSSLYINPARVNVESEIKVENGELINFRPLLPLAKYIRVTELNHIHFSTLQNHVSIHNRKISFPDMEINSSALNLNASGSHDFDNMVDYHLRLLLSDVLSKKVKEENRRDNEFGEIEDDGLGRTKLFIAMKGPVDNPKFSLDKKAVTQKIATDIKEGKNEFKNLIKNEFSGKKDVKAEAPKKKKPELEIDDGKE